MTEPVQIRSASSGCSDRARSARSGQFWGGGWGTPPPPKRGGGGDPPGPAPPAPPPAPPPPPRHRGERGAVGTAVVEPGPPPILWKGEMLPLRPPLTFGGVART